MESILEVHQVRKTYGSHTALRDVSFQVRAGEIISVLGPSGCGKSTLLQLIAGLAQPDAGEIRMRGAVVSSASRQVPPEKRNMNMVFQDYALWPHMNVVDNISYGMRRRKTPAAEIAAQLAKLMGLLHLEGLEHRLPPQLSGGQQQRVAIARALATKPELLLLDEPLSNLDQGLRIEMRTEMAYLFRQLGTTVFHVTHDPDEAFSLADRMIIMRAGGIDQIDDPETCYKRPATSSAAKLLGAGNLLKGKLMSSGGATALLEDGLALTGIAAAHWSGAASEAVIMRFRPDAVSWSAAAFRQAGAASRELAAALESSMRPAAVNHLPVTIVHSVFEGHHWRILAKTDDGQQLTFLHEQRLAAGEAGSVEIRPADLFIYPA